MRKWLLIAAGTLVALIALVLIVGGLYPRDHTASSRITIAQPVDSVWAVVRDQAGTVAWWGNVTGAARVDDPAGREVWRFDMTTGPMAIVVEQDVPPTRLVTRIDVPDDAPFGGTWSYVLEPAGDSTRVTVTEAGYINNLFFRFMANVSFGMHGTMDSYLRDLGRRFGQEVMPTHIE